MTNGERLRTVLEILLELEKNEILGEVSVLDVTDLGNIRLEYDEKTTILLGDPGKMDTKIEWLKAIVSNDKVDHTGIVDLTDPEEDKAVTISPN